VVFFGSYLNKSQIFLGSHRLVPYSAMPGLYVKVLPRPTAVSGLPLPSRSPSSIDYIMSIMPEYSQRTKPCVTPFGGQTPIEVYAVLSNLSIDY